MKKTALIAAIACLIVLAGCSGREENADPPTSVPTAEEVSSQTTPPAENTPTAQQADGESEPDMMHILTQAKTTQYTTGESVDEADLETILLAGLNAPSAVNSQPWHFSVITDAEILAELGEKVLEVYEYGDWEEKFNLWNAHTAILISADDSPYNADFDCGLAAEAMSITAQYLGYGTKFLAHPNAVLNGAEKQHYKEVFAIPDTHTAVAIMLIGVPENSPDAVSSASVRDDFDEKVTFID